MTATSARRLAWAMVLAGLAISAVGRGFSPTVEGFRPAVEGFSRADGLESSVGRGFSPAVERDYPIRAVPFDQVTVDDAFWAPRIERNRSVSIPHIMSENVRTGRVANFEKAAGLKKGDYEGRRFNDSDVYKTIEAAAYSLKLHPDPALRSEIARLVDLIARSQLPDGYLYPARTLGGKPVAGIGPDRWVNLNGSHELYNVGHLYEAALAWQLATGRDDLLKVAIRNFGLVSRVFGPNGRKAVPGHEEIELALVRLYRLTGDERYFSLAKFFLDERGHPHDTQPYPADSVFAIYNDRAYMQDHVPVTDQTRAIGHAVRAMYLYSAMTDVAALAGDASYRAAVERIWTDLVSKRMYITGGIGSRGEPVEGFGDDYELPNKEAYAETCASVGNDLWNQRMFLLHGEAKYIDVLERTLYNGMLSGVSANGDRFFYENPLESSGTVERSSYFEVACCPSNMSRLVQQLPGLIYAVRTSPAGRTNLAPEVFVNLFIGSTAHVTLPAANLTLRQETRYPWEGRVRLTVTPQRPARFDLVVRVPGWARQRPVPSDLYTYADKTAPPVGLAVNGTRLSIDVTGTGGSGGAVAVEGNAGVLFGWSFGDGYIRINRTWSPGDVVEIEFAMPIHRVLAHDGVVADRGRAAIERGPLVYAVEAVDNNGRAASLVLPRSAELKSEFRPSLLGGLAVITGPGLAREVKDGQAGLLEESLRVQMTATHPVQVTAIPYFAWANRGKGEMVVWVAY